MANLSDYSAEDVKIITSLPYRVGLHVSYAEDEEGERDDVLEMQALENCLKEFSKHYEGEPLIQEIADKTLSSDDQWESWAQGVFTIAPACGEAVKTLKAHASDDEVKAYIKMVTDIATAVAQAYGEFGEGAEIESGFFGKVFDGMMKSIMSGNTDSTHHPMNVSAAEESSISNIEAALKKFA